MVFRSMFHLAERWNLSLIEVPVEVENSTRSSVNALRDGVLLLFDLVKIRQRARSGKYPDHLAIQIPSSDQ